MFGAKIKHGRGALACCGVAVTLALTGCGKKEEAPPAEAPPAAQAPTTRNAHAARLALVIGNAAYPDSPLKNPVNDAQAMASKLTALGFQVEKVENLKREYIGRTLSGFAARVKPGDEVVVFYAGHGMQVKGVNYLLAVDADIHTEEDVALNSLNLQTLMDRLEEAKAGVKLIFLDACRNNPFARSFRSAGRGLAKVEDAPSGTLILFATRPGKVAADGEGGNGLYTSELLRVMATPGLTVESMHKRVAAAVETASRGEQEPWMEGSLKGEFYFSSAPTQPAQAQPQPAPQPAQPAPQPLIDNRYRPSADGSEITDTQTGLTWQRCSVGQRWSGSSCEGQAKEFKFDEAQAQAGNGWRVPTVRELQSLRVCSAGFVAKTMDLQDGKAEVSFACNDGSTWPTIHTGAFPNTPSDVYWTSSPLVGDSDLAWYVSFYYGDVHGSFRSNGLHVRLVR